MEFNEKLNNGTLLPVMEEFYSIQGEGFHAGKAAYFIRIGGCDVGCAWCDVKESWNAGHFPLSEIEIIVQRILKYKVKSVVVTGGEPLAFNLKYLSKLLKKEKFTLFLETSGSEPLSGQWDWISLSPKKQSPPQQEIYQNADELKVIVSDIGDLKWAEKNAELVGKDCVLYLQPEWSERREITPAIVDYILENPKWQISIQTHKYLRIP